jgi:hypothetical protein
LLERTTNAALEVRARYKTLDLRKGNKGSNGEETKGIWSEATSGGLDGVVWDRKGRFAGKGEEAKDERVWDVIPGLVTTTLRFPLDFCDGGLIAYRCTARFAFSVSCFAFVLLSYFRHRLSFDFPHISSPPKSSTSTKFAIFSTASIRGSFA